MVSKQKNNHITESKSGMSSREFPNYFFNCRGRKNRQLEESCLKIYVMLSLKTNSPLELHVTLYHKRGEDTLNNPSRKLHYLFNYQVCLNVVKCFTSVTL